MADRHGRRIASLRLPVTAALVFALLPVTVCAGNDRTSLPPAFANFVERMQAAEDFRGCVDASMKKQQLSDADLIRQVAAKGLAPDLYKTISDEVDNPDALLASDGFVPAHANGDEAVAEKALVLAQTLMRRAAEGEGDLSSTRPYDLLFVAVNEAIDAGCAVPKHLQPGGDELRQRAEAIMPLMAEAERVNTCAMDKAKARGLDEEGAFELIDKQGLTAEFRSRVLALAAAMPVDDEQRNKLTRMDQATGLGLGLQLLSATTFDLDAMAKASGVNAVYLDKALDAKCSPSAELMQFIGVSHRANR